MTQTSIPPMFKGRVPSFVAELVNYRRLNNSVNGNPAFNLVFSGGRMHRTQSDSSVSYDVENIGRTIRYADHGDEYPTVAVWLSRAGRVEAMRVTAWRPE